MIRRFAFAAALLAAFALPAPVALAQQPDLRALMDRMDRLQRDMDVMQRNLARGAPSGAPVPVVGPPAGTPAAFIEQTEVRLSQIEGQMRDLTGKLEEALFRANQIQQRLDRLIGDVDFRLGQLERGGAPAQSGTVPQMPAAQAAGPTPPTAAAMQAPPRAGANVAPGEARVLLVPGQPPAAPQQQAQAGGAPAAAAPAAAPVALPGGPPEVQYEFAYGLYQQAVQDRGDFARAESALRQFVGANPQHRNAGDAQYWLGETFYARRDWTAAAREFAAQFRTYPQHAKAPDSLLRLGQSLGQLNRRTDACGTLAELDRRYPGATQAIKLTASRERQRLQCPG